MKEFAQANGPNYDLACKTELQACLRRVRSWRAPPNWCIADWFDEVAAVATGAAWEAQRQFDPARGVPIDAFVHSRVLARTLTRYRQEWGFGTRCVSDPAESRERTDHLEFDQVLDSLGDNLEFEEILQAVTELSEQSRWLIQQLFWAGRTEVEIGRELGISQQAIAKRKRSVLNALRKHLVEHSQKNLVLQGISGNRALG